MTKAGSRCRGKVRGGDRHGEGRAETVVTCKAHRRKQGVFSYKCLRWMVAGCVLIAAAWSWAGTGVPPAGATAPVIGLKELAGEAVSTAKLMPRTVVLVFGEISHEGTRQACDQTLEAIKDPRLSGTQIVPILVVAEEGMPRQLRERAAQGKYPALILHDPQREAFQAYHVLAIPTVMIVDGGGKVVHSMPGFLQRFREILTESLLVATGKADATELERVADARGQEPAHEVVRADRLVREGRELGGAGLLELSAARYKEALVLAPGHVGARLGLGEVYLAQHREMDAEGMFKAVLGTRPESRDAALGLAAVQMGRGAAELTAATGVLQGLISKDPRNARARLLLAQMYDKRGESAAALAEYRSAAECALVR